jgi:predicted nucleotidyltransferase
MSRPPLADHELALVRDVFGRHPEVSAAILFGSRAKGTHTPQSDVDLAVMGDVTPLQAEAIAGELDELPLPYRFEVQPVARITHAPLRAHIDRVGICIYRAALGPGTACVGTSCRGAAAG